MGRRARAMLLLLALAAVAGWVLAGVRVRPEEIATALQEAGLRCDITGRQDGEHFFLVAPTVLETPVGQIHVYEFHFMPLAVWEAKRVGNAGYTIGTALIAWNTPPHFYRRGSTLVHYVGVDETVLTVLEDLLGQQFAGAPPAE